MAPIKVGLLGLSRSGWARNAHWPYLNASENYQVVAIANSSVESAQAAVKDYNLPETAKAYGNPADLAQDDNVDLVVCSVRVDRHVETISPTLKAGKDVFVEWPLGASLAEARELLRLKNEGGVKNAIVGLQSRQAPVIKAIKGVIESGAIGKVLSSTWYGAATNGGPTESETLRYLADRKVGGNLVSIHFGHAVDYVQYVLGYGFSAPPKSLIANRRPDIKIINSEGEIVQESYKKTSDDTIFLHGTLSTGIPLSMNLRGGKPFKGTPGLDWRIYGEKGEIRITAAGPFVQIGYPDMKVEVQAFGGETEIVEIQKDEFDGDEYALPAKNVGRLYRGFQEGREKGDGKFDGVCTFEDAVERHELLDRLYRENGIEV